MAKHFHPGFCRIAIAIVIFTAAFGLGQTSRAEEELWKNCSTPTTQYVLQVPGSLVRSTGPGVTGCTYQTADGEFTVEAAQQTSSTPQDQSIDSRIQKEIGVLGTTVTDQKKGQNWFALTGVTPDGTEYYRIHYLNGADWVTLRITFPHSKHKAYDKWVTRIDESFVPFVKAEQAAAKPEKQKEKDSQD